MSKRGFFPNMGGERILMSSDEAHLINDPSRWNLHFKLNRYPERLTKLIQIALGYVLIWNTFCYEPDLGIRTAATIISTKGHLLDFWHVFLFQFLRLSNMQERKRRRRRNPQQHRLFCFASDHLLQQKCWTLPRFMGMILACSVLATTLSCYWPTELCPMVTELALLYHYLWEHMGPEAEGECCRGEASAAGADCSRAQRHGKIQALFAPCPPLHSDCS